MVVASALFLILLSYFKFKKLFNPVFYFVVIHYLHNLSYYVLKKNGLDASWRADASVDFSTFEIIANFNVISLWLVSLILLLFLKKKDLSLPIINNLRKNDFCFYIYLLFSIIILYNNRELISGTILYGANQAIDSISSFDPLNRLWSFRIYFILYFIIFNSPSTRLIWIVILIELMMSFLLTERKDLSILLFGIFVLFSSKKRIKFSFAQTLGLITVFFGLICLPIYRSFSNEKGFINKLQSTINFIEDTSDLIIYYGTGFVNSEGVQNWTLQLINDKSLILLYGLSYLQGLVNIIILRPFQPDWLVNSQASYYFKNVAYPGVTNHGYDFSFTAEAILNFGINGGYVSYLCLSFLIITIYKRKSRTWIFQRIMIWPILLISFRTDSTSMFRLFSYVYFTPFIINLINSFLHVWNRRIV